MWWENSLGVGEYGSEDDPAWNNVAVDNAAAADLRCWIILWKRWCQQI